MRIVFIGDSITDCGRDRMDPASLGDGYVRLLAGELGAPRAGNVIINAGISGDRAVDLERRWDRDVLSEPPDVLSVYVGVNDMWRRYDSDDPTSADEFGATCHRLLTSARAAGVTRILLMEPWFLPILDGQQAWLADLDDKREALRALAVRHAATLIPLNQVMTTAAAQSGATAIAEDGVHPTPAGHRLIADAWLDAFRKLEPTGA